jgi:nitrate/nitrite transport system substrate-binding protein
MKEFDASTLEKPQLKLGIVPLTDCAVLVMAKSKGFFAKYGLDVSLSPEVSWANIRDKVQAGLLDGAQMLAAMPIASTLGMGGIKTPMITAFSLDLNGNGITVSNDLYRRMLEMNTNDATDPSRCVHALKKVIDADTHAGRKPMTFAMVFPFSSHNYQLRYWLATAGIDPEVDLRLTVVPPSQMVENLIDKNIDGFCVGEPWNEVAVARGVGRALLTGYEIWNNSPEKVFAVTRAWAETYPNTHRAVLMSLFEAAEWSDLAANRREIVDTLVAGKFINVDSDVVKMSMLGTFKFAKDEPSKPMPDFNVFHRYTANYPWLSHAEWFILQMLRWGQLSGPVNISEIAKAVYRPDIYAEIADFLGKPCPVETHKTEGGHSGTWHLRGSTGDIVMGADRFIDGKHYNPDDPIGYLRSFSVSRLRYNLDDLTQLNPRTTVK